MDIYRDARRDPVHGKPEPQVVARPKMCERIVFDVERARLVIDGVELPHAIAEHPTVTLLHAGKYPFYQVTVGLFADHVEFTEPVDGPTVTSEPDA